MLVHFRCPFSCRFTAFSLLLHNSDRHTVAAMARVRP